MLQKYKILRQLWTPFIKKNVHVYASSAAFYLFVSLFPASVLFLSVLSQIPIDAGKMTELISRIIPLPLQQIIFVLWEEINASGFVFLSVSAITTLWSASKGIMSLTDGLNGVLELQLSLHYIKRHLYSILYFVLIVTGFTIIMVAVIIDGPVLSILETLLPASEQAIKAYRSFRWIISFSILYPLVFLIYQLLPAAAFPTKLNVIFSAATSALWLFLSSIFTIYTGIFSSYEKIYGSLGLLLLSAIWLRLCLSLILYGAIFMDLVRKNEYHPIIILKKLIKKT